MLQAWLAGRAPETPRVRSLAARVRAQAEEQGRLEERERLHDAAAVERAYQAYARQPDEPC